MPKKRKSAATSAGTSAGNGQSNLGVSKTQPLLGTAKGKTGKKDSQEKQVPKTTITSGTTSTRIHAVGKASKDLIAPKTVKKAAKTKEDKPSQKQDPQPLKLSFPEQKGSTVGKLEVEKEDPSRSVSLEQSNVSSTCVGRKNDASKSDSSTQETNTFILAAATPVPISPAVERQFYESQLLLFVLDRVRGDHTKRQNYHGELDQDATELRRSFLNKLAYICDFNPGGSTVTALALQKTYQGTIFWLAANETVKPKAMHFLREVLQLLKKVKGNGVSKKAIETQLLDRIVSFNEKRLEHYWSRLRIHLNVCIERLGKLVVDSIERKESTKDLKSLSKLLSSLEQVSTSRVDLVRECFEARTQSSAFDTLALLSASGKNNNTLFDGVRHLLGRLGEHLKATKTIVSAALRFPALLDVFEIQVRPSTPSSCFFQSRDDISLDGMAKRIFSEEGEIIHYQEALDTLERTSNGALLSDLRKECCFKTRIHAELLLADLFYWKQFEFVDGDAYIGCSKPACFNCFQYFLAHPGAFALPASHNKLYLTWRPPDILDENISVAIASKIREAITGKINHALRAELRRQIDGRYAKRPRHHDSLTGTSSSIQGAKLHPLQDISEYGSDSAAEVSPNSTEHPVLPNRPPLASSLSSNQEEDDSDDDFAWYQSRISSSVLRRGQSL